MEPVRAHVLVSGLVQGVFFRYATADHARGLGLTGWVRNCPDGRVEVVFEGVRPAVEDAIAWCRHGPPSARVEDVAISWEEPVGESQFGIK